MKNLYLFTNDIIISFSFTAEGKIHTVKKWAACPASCAHLGEGKSCYQYCIDLGYKNGGECYYHGGPYGDCCCNSD